MTKRLFSWIGAFGVASLLFASMAVPASPAAAYDPFKGQCKPVDELAKGEVNPAICNNSDTADGAIDETVKDVVNTLLYVLGAIAVIMIVVGGIRYTLSNGDSNQTSSAKDTILYAVVGLVVAMLAYAIVNFVVGRI